MAEKIKLFELDIDTKNLLTQLSNTRKEIENLQKAQKENRRESEEERKAFEANAIVLKQLSAEYRNNQKVLDAVTKAQTQTIDTVDDARKALSAVSVLWAQVTKVEGENSKQAQDLAAQKLNLTNRLKELESATGDTRRNVGNYTQSILEAAKVSGGFEGVLGGFGEQLNTAAKGFQAAKGGSTGFIAGLKGIGGAITATGIGALVQILVALVQGLSKVKTVTDPLEQAFKAVSAVIGELVNRGEALINAFGFLLNGDFTNAAKSATSAVDDLGGSLANAAKEAAELAKAQQDLDDASQRNKILAAEANKQIAILIAKSKDRTKTEAERIGFLVEANRIEAEAFKRAKDEALERLRIDKQNLQLKTKITDKELENFVLQRGTTKELEKLQEKIDKGEDLYIKYSDSRIALANIEKDSISQTERLQGRINQFKETERQENEKIAAEAEKQRDKALAAEQKRVEEQKKLEQERKDARIAAIEEEIRLYEAKNKTIITEETELTSELVAEEVKRVAELTGLKEKLYREQLEQGTITQGQFTLLLQELDNEFNTFTAGLSSRAANEALNKLTQAIAEARLNLAQGKTGDGVLLTQAQVDKEKQLLTELEQAEVAATQARFANQVGKEAELQLALFEIQEKFRKERQALDTQLLTEEQQRDAFAFETRIAILTAQGESELEIRREQLARQQELEIAAAEAIGASVSDVEEKYRLLNQQLDREAVEGRLTIASEYLTSFSQLVGDNTQFGKLAASAAAAINTFISAQEAFRSQLIPTDPSSFPRAIAAAAFATATGLKTIANINKVKPPVPKKTAVPKFEEGGFVIGGKYHNAGGTTFTGSDGTTFEAEKDEAMFILNRNATSQLKALSSLNNLFPMASRVGTFQSGGFPALSAGELTTIDLLSGIQQQQIVVDVKDIISETGRRVQVVDSATI